jgi:hypothetical protein
MMKFAPSNAPTGKMRHGSGEEEARASCAVTPALAEKVKRRAGERKKIEWGKKG